MSYRQRQDEPVDEPSLETMKDDTHMAVDSKYVSLQWIVETNISHVTRELKALCVVTCSQSSQQQIYSFYASASAARCM